MRPRWGAHDERAAPQRQPLSGVAGKGDFGRPVIAHVGGLSSAGSRHSLDLSTSTPSHRPIQVDPKPWPDNRSTKDAAGPPGGGAGSRQSHTYQKLNPAPAKGAKPWGTDSCASAAGSAGGDPPAAPAERLLSNKELYLARQQQQQHDGDVVSSRASQASSTPAEPGPAATARRATTSTTSHTLHAQPLKTKTAASAPSGGGELMPKLPASVSSTASLARKTAAVQPHGAASRPAEPRQPTDAAAVDAPPAPVGVKVASGSLQSQSSLGAASLPRKQWPFASRDGADGGPARGGTADKRSASDVTGTSEEAEMNRTVQQEPSVTASALQRPLSVSSTGSGGRAPAALSLGAKLLGRSPSREALGESRGSLQWSERISASQSQSHADSPSVRREWPPPARDTSPSLGKHSESTAGNLYTPTPTPEPARIPSTASVKSPAAGRIKAAPVAPDSYGGSPARASSFDSVRVPSPSTSPPRLGHSHRRVSGVRSPLSVVSAASAAAPAVGPGWKSAPRHGDLPSVGSGSSSPRREHVALAPSFKSPPSPGGSPVAGAPAPVSYVKSLASVDTRSAGPASPTAYPGRKTPVSHASRGAPAAPPSHNRPPMLSHMSFASHSESSASFASGSPRGGSPRSQPYVKSMPGPGTRGSAPSSPTHYPAVRLASGTPFSTSPSQMPASPGPLAVPNNSMSDGLAGLRTISPPPARRGDAHAHPDQHGPGRDVSPLTASPQSPPPGDVHVSRSPESVGTVTPAQAAGGRIDGTLPPSTSVSLSPARTDDGDYLSPDSLTHRVSHDTCPENALHAAPPPHAHKPPPQILPLKRKDSGVAVDPRGAPHAHAPRPVATPADTQTQTTPLTLYPQSARMMAMSPFQLAPAEAVVATAQNQTTPSLVPLEGHQWSARFSPIRPAATVERGTRTSPHPTGEGHTQTSPEPPTPLQGVAPPMLCSLREVPEAPAAPEEQPSHQRVELFAQENALALPCAPDIAAPAVVDTPTRRALYACQAAPLVTPKQRSPLYPDGVGREDTGITLSGDHLAAARRPTELFEQSQVIAWPDAPPPSAGTLTAVKTLTTQDSACSFDVVRTQPTVSARSDGGVEAAPVRHATEPLDEMSIALTASQNTMQRRITDDSPALSAWGSVASASHPSSLRTTSAPRGARDAQGTPLSLGRTRASSTSVRTHPSIPPTHSASTTPAGGPLRAAPRVPQHTPDDGALEAPTAPTPARTANGSARVSVAKRARGAARPQTPIGGGASRATTPSAARIQTPSATGAAEAAARCVSPARTQSQQARVRFHAERERGLAAAAEEAAAGWRRPARDFAPPPPPDGAPTAAPAATGAPPSLAPQLTPVRPGAGGGRRPGWPGGAAPPTSSGEGMPPLVLAAHPPPAPVVPMPNGVRAAAPPPVNPTEPPCVVSPEGRPLTSPSRRAAAHAAFTANGGPGNVAAPPVAAAGDPAPAFVPSNFFTGQREGYYYGYQAGQGLGYIRVQPQQDLPLHTPSFPMPLPVAPANSLLPGAPFAPTAADLFESVGVSVV